MKSPKSDGGVLLCSCFLWYHKIMKVLLIEDDPVFQELYRDAFNKDGFDVIFTGNGKLGIDMASKDQPNFILLDIMLPIIDGITVFKQLKRNELTRDIPVAFLTVVPEGVPQSLHQDPKMLEGSVGYWSKDKFTPMEIVGMVKKYLKK